MGTDSKIQWTHHTFNPWVGCTKVSPGCKNCYAATMANARPHLVLGTGVSRAIPGTPRQLPVWGDDAPRRVTSGGNWREPLKWNRQAQAAGERRRVFCASLADVFEDDRPADRALGPKAARNWPVTAAEFYRAAATLDDVRLGLWELIQQTPHLDWLLLTKRPQNVLKMVPKIWWEPIPAWPRNVWIGTTAEDQQRAEERLPHLLEIPAPVRFVSYEPAVGPVDFGRWMKKVFPSDYQKIDWLIAGGESGPGARPCDVAWLRAAARQAQEARVPVFVKQLGANITRWRADNTTDPWERFGGVPRVTVEEVCRQPRTARGQLGERQTVHLLDKKGGNMAEWPADLQVREFPQAVTRG